MMKSKKKIYLKLLKEFYPTILAEAKIAKKLGPPDSEHKCSDCPGCEWCGQILCEDCEWYNWSVKFFQRLDSGEFDDFKKEY